MKIEDFENENDKVIHDKLKQKTWNEIRANDSWAIFKIMAEFVNGYENMARIGPCVSIFGSARKSQTTNTMFWRRKLRIKLANRAMA